MCNTRTLTAKEACNFIAYACVVFYIYLLVDLVHFVSLAHYDLGCVNFNQSNDVFPVTLFRQ
jgi:hypothetical protein